ncbi:MAG: hypothetical protein HY067_09480 [Betaproteobacteria bacterium]|nr:hypothetical protein [Betaproteobacteria bacterium]
MRAAIWITVSLLLSSCAATISTRYPGSDAGYAIIGVGAASTTEYSSYSFLFHHTGKKETGRFTYFQHNIFTSQKPDYSNEDETGVVEVATLPPGKYELTNFDIFSNRFGGPQIHYSSRKEFSIPFEIRPGEVVYLGNYQANIIKGRNFFGMPVNGGAFFVVTDRSEIDLQLAKARFDFLPMAKTQDATPDAKQVGNPFLVSADQARHAREAAER